MRACFRAVCIAATLAVAARSASPAPSSVSEPSISLKLRSAVHPGGGTIGLTIDVRINGSRAQRFLLDSGADLVVIDKKIASRVGCNPAGDIALASAAARELRKASTCVAREVDAGGLVLRDVPVAVVDGRLSDSFDGVLPLALFDRFQIRLDAAAKTMELHPYGSDLTESQPALAVQSNRLLFVEGALNGSHRGYFLLDTGAAFNAISTDLARRSRLSMALNAPTEVRGGGGPQSVPAPVISGVQKFQAGVQEIPLESVVALDMRLPSESNRLAVAGLLGYPALRNAIVIINYRDSRVHFEPK